MMVALRRAMRSLVLALHLAIAPSWVDAWRLDPATRITFTLVVGEPMTPLRRRG